MTNQPIEEKWKRENCGHDVMKCLTEVEHLHKEIDILADYLLKHHHKEICGSAVDTAINIISGIPNLLEQERTKAYNQGMSDNIKAKIFQDNTEAVEQERKRMSDEIEKRKMDGYCKDENCSHDECGTIRWFNKALNISLSIINK